MCAKLKRVQIVFCGWKVEFQGEETEVRPECLQRLRRALNAKLNSIPETRGFIPPSG